MKTIILILTTLLMSYTVTAQSDYGNLEVLQTDFELEFFEYPLKVIRQVIYPTSKILEDSDQGTFAGRYYRLEMLVDVVDSATVESYESFIRQNTNLDFEINLINHAGDVLWAKRLPFTYLEHKYTSDQTKMVLFLWLDKVPLTILPEVHKVVYVRPLTKREKRKERKESAKSTN